MTDSSSDNSKLSSKSAKERRNRKKQRQRQEEKDDDSKKDGSVKKTSFHIPADRNNRRSYERAFTSPRQVSNITSCINTHIYDMHLILVWKSRSELDSLSFFVTRSALGIHDLMSVRMDFQTVVKACVSLQSPLSVQDSVFTPRRNSKSSIFSFRGRARSENNYADDERSVCEETDGRRDSPFLPPRSERLYSNVSKGSLTPRVMLPSNGKVRYVVDSNGIVMVSGDSSMPNSPSGLLTPEMSKKRAMFEDFCVRGECFRAQTLLAAGFIFAHSLVDLLFYIFSFTARMESTGFIWMIVLENLKGISNSTFAFILHIFQILPEILNGAVFTLIVKWSIKVQFLAFLVLRHVKACSVVE